MDVFLTKIKDLNEQLVSADEIIADSSLVQTVLDGLPDSYQSFASTLRLMMKGNPNAQKFDELITVLLQEEQSRQNRSNIRVADQAFMANQKGKGKASHYSKQKVASSTSNTKADKDGDKSKKKEAYMAVADAALAKIDFANMVHDAKWAFTVECNLTLLHMMHV